MAWRLGVNLGGELHAGYVHHWRQKVAGVGGRLAAVVGQSRCGLELDIPGDLQVLRQLPLEDALVVPEGSELVS